ncbi:hypothetical protein [Bacillus sp. JCM 19041]|uniref:hypothetical protein n=1 Tax=Bacillus sp. JCM 19041 TaxID=1460637 RepID=UPI0006D0A1A6
MAEQEKTRVWTYALAGLVFVAIGILAIWNDVWYRIVVLAALVTLFVFVIKKSKKIERLLEDLKASQIVAADRGIEEKNQLEETKEHDLRALEEKEFQLQKLDLDRTQLFEELLSKTQLEEAEKRTIRDRLQQTDNEMSHVRQEWINASNRLMSMMRGTKKLFVRESPMKEIAASMDQDVLESGSFAALNSEIQRLLPRLSKESENLLAKSNYIDHELQLTRSGYKALLQASEEEKKA